MASGKDKQTGEFSAVMWAHVVPSPVPERAKCGTPMGEEVVLARAGPTEVATPPGQNLNVNKQLAAQQPGTDVAESSESGSEEDDTFETPAASDDSETELDEERKEDEADASVSKRPEASVQMPSELPAAWMSVPVVPGTDRLPDYEQARAVRTSAVAGMQALFRQQFSESERRREQEAERRRAPVEAPRTRARGPVSVSLSDYPPTSARKKQ